MPLSDARSYPHITLGHILPGPISSAATRLASLVQEVHTKASQACRREQDEDPQVFYLLEELTSLDKLLRRVYLSSLHHEYFASTPGRRDAFSAIVENFQFDLDTLTRILHDYHALPEHEQDGGLPSFIIRWTSTGQRAVEGVDDPLSLKFWVNKMCSHKSLLCIYFKLITRCWGSFIDHMTYAITLALVNVNDIVSHLLHDRLARGSTSTAADFLLPAARDDEDAVWAEIEQRLVDIPGNESVVVSMHAHVFKAYMRTLGDWGILDINLPLPSESVGPVEVEEQRGRRRDRLSLSDDQIQSSAAPGAPAEHLGVLPGSFPQ